VRLASSLGAYRFVDLEVGNFEERKWLSIVRMVVIVIEVVVMAIVGVVRRTRDSFLWGHRTHLHHPPV
jgi:hypothetical protein